MEFVQQWVGVGLSVLSLAGVVWALLQSPSKKNADDIAVLRKAVGEDFAAVRTEIKFVDDKADAIGGRISTIETTIRQMPDKDGMHRLELGLERMNGEISTLSERLKPIDTLSRRLQEVLLERANK